LREKYHPEKSKPLRQEINKRKGELYTAFVADLNEGKFDKISFDEVVKAKSTIVATTDVDKKPQANGAGDGDVKKEENEEGQEGQSSEETHAENGETGETGEKEEHVAIKEEDQDAAMDTQEDQDSSKANVSEAAASEVVDIAIAYDNNKSHALFIKTVPPPIGRSKLVELCSKVEGFSYLVLSDPNPMKKFHRLGWIIFKDEQTCKKAFNELNGKKIDDFGFYLAPHQPTLNRSRTAPFEASAAERVEKDLGQIKKLAAVLDEEAGLDKVSGNGVQCVTDRLSDVIIPRLREDLSNEMAGEEDEEQREKEKERKVAVKSLDFYILYLRRVHMYDYYSAAESDSPEDFCRRCPVYFRRRSADESAKITKPGKPSEAEKFFERLDTRISLRIRKPIEGEDIEKLGGKNLDDEIERMASKNVTKESEAKYRCKECAKLFKGEEYVKKHIRGKHPTLVQKVKEDVEFFNAYVRDLNRVQNPSNSQPTQPNMMMMMMGPGAQGMGMGMGPGPGPMGMGPMMPGMGMGPMGPMAAGPGWGMMNPMMGMAMGGPMMGMAMGGPMMGVGGGMGPGGRGGFGGHGNRYGGSGRGGSRAQSSIVSSGRLGPPPPRSNDRK
ncbi:hypothetical protein HK102_008491, partial [Quaeritorhiza haematococci]